MNSIGISYSDIFQYCLSSGVKLHKDQTMMI